VPTRKGDLPSPPKPTFCHRVVHFSHFLREL
jgi:hypothetical protein